MRYTQWNNEPSSKTKDCKNNIFYPLQTFPLFYSIVYVMADNFFFLSLFYTILTFFTSYFIAIFFHFRSPLTRHKQSFFIMVEAIVTSCRKESFSLTCERTNEWMNEGVCLYVWRTIMAVDIYISITFYHLFPFYNMHIPTIAFYLRY